jgi:hypothetical protein
MTSSPTTSPISNVSIESILERLKKDKIEHDSDLVNGQREPYETVLYRGEVPNQNLLIFWVKRYLRVMYEGVKIYLPIHLLPIILFKRGKIRTEPLQLLKSLFKNQLLSSCFIASLTEGFNGVVILFHLLGLPDHPFTIYTAGFLCGLSCLCEQKSRRKELTIYCATRAFEILSVYGQVNNWFKHIDYWCVALFALSMVSSCLCQYLFI